MMSLIGMGIAVACQFISRYVLGFQTYSADLISGGVIGLILGTILGSSLIDSSSSKRNLIRDLGMPKTEN
ncbi:hypothetical protein RSal33209_3021 [Renibacterium salmoninarum ATCC 33209]|uniref:Uncharacterized protein n=1 Tax=Renibacterium salmoninarum (strain ATCC 33209 / DSM 20767 / JCM 11484 / NBRC 15589 / NCIMB 2235) TaxID=288705 RepID=A9WU71_RENSM|nr:hypothetical protein RSal33209_3021 [Renibacterium salmoninarum ATCC 33209]